VTLIKDVLDEFNRLDTLTIDKHCANGGLGKYGRTYKLSTQEVCYWIREHIKPINKILMKLAKPKDTLKRVLNVLSDLKNKW
jgi:hypothetical protein